MYYYIYRWHECFGCCAERWIESEGIQKLIERLGFKMEDVYAFGDGLNDIEMLTNSRDWGCNG